MGRLAARLGLSTLVGVEITDSADGPKIIDVAGCSISVGDACAALGVSRSRIYQLIASHTLQRSPGGELTVCSVLNRRTIGWEAPH